MFDVTAPAPTSDSAASTPESAASIEAGLLQLPSYTRSLLRIKVPVRVTLATTQLSLARIVELAPGSIIQFPKACDDPLLLSVGNRDIAVGDAVKVGEKFGLRISSMVLPEEKFWSLGSKHPPA